MLAITRKTDYAFIALMHLAQDPDGCVSAREIAERYGVPLPLLMNILKQLTHEGLANSSRGPRGGYSLAMPAGEITLYDVVRAVEGPIQLVQCMELREGETAEENSHDCNLAGCCPVRSPIQRIHDRLVAFLEEITLEDLAKENTSCPSVQSLTVAGEQDRAESDLSG
jgi:Rrf2 family protein